MARRADARTGWLVLTTTSVKWLKRTGVPCGSEREVSAIPDDPCPVCLLRLGLAATHAPESMAACARLLRSTTRFDQKPRSVERAALLGTVTYMAPEVLRGQQATRASDIYSFGILVYEVLVGRPPFKGSASEIVAGHCSGVAPRPTTLNASLPSEFDNALLSALERVPVRRPQRAIDVVRQIRSAVFSARVRAWRQKEIPRRIAVAAVAAVFLPFALAPVTRFRLLQQIEHRSVDARFSALPKRAPDPRLILVSLDEASLTPIPRR